MDAANWPYPRQGPTNRAVATVGADFGVAPQVSWSFQMNNPLPKYASASSRELGIRSIPRTRWDEV